jgi:hypothetical protein
VSRPFVRKATRTLAFSLELLVDFSRAINGRHRNLAKSIESKSQMVSAFVLTGVRATVSDLRGSDPGGFNRIGRQYFAALETADDSPDIAYGVKDRSSPILPARWPLELASGHGPVATIGPDR